MKQGELVKVEVSNVNLNITEVDTIFFLKIITIWSAIC